MNAIPKKILLIRPEMMGDTILLTPIISAIKKYYPGSEIYLLLQHPMEEIVKNNKEVAGYIFTEKKLNFQEYIGLLKTVRSYNFDTSVVFEDNPTPSYAYLCLLAGIKNRIGDKSRLAYGWAYNKGVWINSADPTRHHIELYLELLKPFGIFNCILPLKINIDPNTKVDLPKKEPGEIFIGLHIGTGGGNRALLPETYAKISDMLCEKIKCKVILVGGERELETLKIIRSLAKNPFIDKVGGASIEELFVLISKMGIFIGVDSGPLHAASALSVPTIAIYTAKDVNPARWFPWMNRNMIIKSPADCMLKCSHRECEFDYCLEALNPNDVVLAAAQLLSGNGNNTIEETRKEALKQ